MLFSYIINVCEEITFDLKAISQVFGLKYQKRLEELPEAELESLLAKVEEEKLQLKLSQEKLSQSE